VTERRPALVLSHTVQAGETLNAQHYLGGAGARAKLTYADRHGLIVLTNPSSRRLPQDWLELSRWLEEGGRGSEQWAACVRWLRGMNHPSTTVVSYSDPSVGHSGGLYRASNWRWAPTWHILQPPPSGGGTRGGKRQEPKHRWVYLLRPDPKREAVLALKVESIIRAFPNASYKEPPWKHGRPQS
jgi:hypothetical protein